MWLQRSGVISGAEQDVLCAPLCRRGGRWRWTLATFEVSAFSGGRVAGLRGPGCSISNAALGQRHFVFVFHGRRDRLLMRLQSLRSDLTLRLLSPISTFTMRGKEERLLLVSVTLICGSDRF